MLDKAEIEADLARGEAEDLRDAFDALAGWDGASTMAGVDRAEVLMDLFERVCVAVRDDPGRVPSETARALSRGRGGAPSSIDTYGEAARFALAARRTWWPAFSASFPADG